MALYLSTAIRLQWQTSASQRSSHLPNKSVGGGGGGCMSAQKKKVGKIYRKEIWKPMNDAVFFAPQPPIKRSSAREAGRWEDPLARQNRCCASVSRAGSGVMKLINKWSLVCAARCCAVLRCLVAHEYSMRQRVGKCAAWNIWSGPWGPLWRESCNFRREMGGGRVGGVRGGELGRERGREKNANKMKGGKQQQSAGLRIIWLICFANLIFKTGSLSRSTVK